MDPPPPRPLPLPRAPPVPRNRPRLLHLRHTRHQISPYRYDTWRQLDYPWPKEVRLDELPAIIEKVRAQLRLAMWPPAPDPATQIIHHVLTTTILATNPNIILRNRNETLLIVEPAITPLTLNNWINEVPTNSQPTNTPPNPTTP